MTSEAFVWVYLPDHVEPLVCGRLLSLKDGAYSFICGRSYRDRDDSIALAPDVMPISATPSSADAWARCPLVPIRVRRPRRLGPIWSRSIVTAVRILTNWIYF